MDERLINFLLEESNQVVVMTDTTGKITSSNRAASQVLKDHGNVLDYFQDRQEILNHLKKSGEEKINFVAILKSGFPIKVHVLCTDMLVWVFDHNQRLNDGVADVHDQYRSLAEHAIDAVVLFDRGEIQYISPVFEELSGYAPHEVFNESSFLDYVLPEDKEVLVPQLLEDRKNKKERGVYTYRFRHKDGRIIWLENQVKRVFRVEEQNYLSVTHIRDVTERVITEQQLAEREAELRKIKIRFELAEEASKTGVWDVNLKTGEFYIDPRGKQIIGYDDKDITNDLSMWFSLIHPEDLELISEEAAKLYDGTGSFEAVFRVRHKARYIMWVMARGKAHKNEEGEFHRVTGTVTDITERKKYEQALLESELKFKELAESFGDVFLAVDSELRLIYWNRFCEERFGKSSKQVLGHPFLNIFPQYEHSDWHKALQQVLETGDRRYVILDEFHQDKRSVLDIKIYPSQQGLSVFAQDITEKTISQEALIESKKVVEEALQSKEEFLSILSHEIRTPLNAVLSLAYLLEKKVKSSDQQKLVNSLKFSSENLRSLINNILDYSKINAGKIDQDLEDFDLVALLENITESYRPQTDDKGLYLRLELDENLPQWVHGDIQRLTQVLNNLLSNAIKFTESGGITLSISVVQEEPDHDEMLFEIRDTGIGIPPDKQQKVFDPFQQVDSTTSRKYGGTGLGLSIIKKIIEGFSGSIELTSQLEQGSTFAFRLPMAKPVQTTAANPVPPIRELIKNRKVSLLYVDDIETNQFVMESLCRQWGVQLTTARSGPEAISLVGEQSFDLVLMDIQMPEMDGFLASKEIKKIKPDLPVVAYTAEVRADDKRKIKDAGMVDVIVKPIDPERLFHHIKSYSGTPQPNTPTHSPQLKLDFSFVDQTFHLNPEGYQTFLEQTLKELADHESGLLKALADKDLAPFSAHKHDLTALLSNFSYHNLTHDLDRIKAQWDQHQVNPNGLQDQFELIKEQITHKLEGLQP